MNPRNLRDHVEKLNIFVEVCRARSFHGAARNLGLSQPSLSQAVKILEEILETRLLTRSNRGIELTPAGEKLHYFSERLVSEVEGMENRLRSPDQPMIGSLNIGTYATLTTYLMPKFLVQMAKTYDQMTFGLTTLRADELANALISRRCHMVVGTVEFKQKTITQFELYRDYFGFFVSARKSAAGSRKTKVDPKRTPLIYVADAKTDDGPSIGKILADAELPHLHQYDIDNFESVRALVAEGLGVGVLPQKLAKRYVEKGDLTEFNMPKLGKKFGLHRFYGAILTQDLEDIRTSTAMKELQTWCREM